MPISDLDVITIAEAKDCQKGTEVKIQGMITHSLQPRKMWKGISQFIVVKDNTESIGCNVSAKSISDGYELGENVMVVGERGEYPEKDRRTGQPTGGVVKNINGYVESNWLDVADEQNEEHEKQTSHPDMADEYTSKKIETEMENEAEENSEKVALNRVVVKQKPYVQNDYWRDKFLLDVERQEMYKINNDYIVRECAIKAVTELVGNKEMGITGVDSYFEFADRIVKWIKDENENFEEDTEANMIISGLSPLKKQGIVDWINEKRIGTDIEEDRDFLIKLNVQVLSHQTIKELRETVDTMMKYFREPKEE